MIINMNVGGTERALLNMIAAMPEENYDITILMLERYGDFLDLIPQRVHKQYLNGYQDIKDLLNKPPKEVIMGLLKKKQFVKAFNLSQAYFLSKLIKNRQSLFKYILKEFPCFTNEYDVAIAYAGPMDFISYFVVHKIKAQKKIQWIHFDVTKIGFNQRFASKVYQYFDHVFAVSNEGKHKLIQALPNLNHKINTFLNRISPQQLQESAHQGIGFTDQFNGLKILTVGRLSKEKGQDLAISVLANLLKSGLNVRWYCIGDGSAKETYEKLIREYGIEKEFILLGSQTNPYPFMNQCDIYVQPSRHEGYCITLAEAKCFSKPIITTDFTGAHEQIEDGETGLIVSFNEQELAEALQNMINDAQLRNKFQENLQHVDEDTGEPFEMI
jgi:glycosyltransferase involved in cell wall biosynthesis